MGGARERFGGGGVIVLADHRRLAAESARNRSLAALEGVDHIHLEGGQPQELDRKQRGPNRQKQASTKVRRERLKVKHWRKETPAQRRR